MSAVQTITKQETQTAVRIKSIKIEKLFEIFDYDIEYAEGGNVLILTGPNGFGKTTILNVLYSLFDWEFDFFYELIFDKITISLNNDSSIEIEKEYEEEDDIKVYFSWLHKEVKQIKKHVARGNHFISEKIAEILNLVRVYFIKEQRLYINKSFANIRDEKAKERTVIDNLYQNFSKEHLNHPLYKYSTYSQHLDSTYPRRLILEKEKITKKEYDRRLINLQEKQNKLIKYDLYDSDSQKITIQYSESDAKALSVYLNDLEKKLSVFDELLAKLDLFTEILNKRRFTFKVIKVDSEKGFYFETSKGKELEMDQLSSGEQHEVVLLYELIFNTTPNTLVLIDEPEISLHITWQKEFVKDLLKIIELQNFQVMIATHAPAIVNDRWDLVYSLAKTI